MKRFGSSRPTACPVDRGGGLTRSHLTSAGLRKPEDGVPDADPGAMHPQLAPREIASANCPY